MLCDGVHYEKKELIGPTHVLFWVYVAVYVALVLFAGKIVGP